MKNLFILILMTILSLGQCFCQNTEDTAIISEYAACDSIRNDPEYYDMLCDCIRSNNLIFPVKSVVSGKILKNEPANYGPFKTVAEFVIDSFFIDSFRSIVADTSNFGWGEMGTTWTDYMVEFYDSKGKRINQAYISYDGMLWIYPTLGTAKWGLLRTKGEVELKTLMNKYTNNEGK